MPKLSGMTSDLIWIRTAALAGACRIRIRCRYGSRCRSDVDRTWSVVSRTQIASCDEIVGIYRCFGIAARIRRIGT